MNAKSTPSKNSSNSYTFEKIANTPFYVKGDKEQGYTAVMGNFLISEVHKTKAAVIKWVNEKSWELIANVVACIICAQKQLEHENQNQKTEAEKAD